LNNIGTIDAGEGNLGAGFSTELSEAGNNFTIENLGSIVGRGDAGAGAATAGDGIRLDHLGYSKRCLLWKRCWSRWSRSYWRCC